MPSGLAGGENELTNVTGTGGDQVDGMSSAERERTRTGYERARQTVGLRSRGADSIAYRPSSNAATNALGPYNRNASGCPMSVRCVGSAIVLLATTFATSVDPRSTLIAGSAETCSASAISTKKEIRNDRRRFPRTRS